jgi:hypothetical protein
LAGFFGTGTNNGRCPVKAFAISMVAGAALCSVMSTAASAMPMSNLAAAASDLALSQSVRYVCNRYRCWWRPNYGYRYGYGSYYGYRPSYYGYGPSYYGYGPGYGYGPSSPRYP